uniref:Glycosyltransferase RgtA/B/C/D-like domain-containing protein n=1 Tax=Solibacter usitatus (strain Ellin6076) TaxID=234267 RepID=Q01YY8_SOLUE
MIRRLITPSLLDVFFAALLLTAFAQQEGLRSLLADGDTGWHIRTGELVLQTGRVPVTDPFSFSRPREPWFAWEWLSDVVFAIVWRWRGLAGVAALAGSVLALAATVLLMGMLRRGCGLWLGVAATMAAVSASSVHYLARPHVFSILFYTAGLWVLQEDRVRSGWGLWLLAPMTALWANLHGGFTAWLATLGLLVAMCALERDWRRVRRYGCLAGLCGAASLANPYGWQLHVHIACYLNSSWIVDHVQEFQSPRIRSEGMLVFAVLLLAGVAMASRADRFAALLTLVWGFMALRSARHVPFFAIVAAPVVASGIARYWALAAARGGGRAPVRIFWALSQEFGRKARVSLWLPAAAAVMVMSAPAVGFPDSLFPVLAVDRNLGQLTRRAAMPRVLTSDQWADYLIFRLYPEQRVFFDGRSDFYGAALGADYRKLLAGEKPWRELLERYQFDLALLPHEWALSTSLEREPGWHRVYEDSVAVLYAHDSGGTP